MFKCDQLIYIQMQKTACTHIASLLSHLFDGEQIGKHNAATIDQIKNTRYFISSIRNPWDWYLSLWTFGVQGKGAFMKRLTQKKNIIALFKLMFKNPKKNYHMVLIEILKDTALWNNVYDNIENIESFRRWLKLIHNPDNSRFLGEGYETTRITSFCGFMTYRYLYLCCKNVKELRIPGMISNYSDLVQFEKNNCYIDFFVRQESLEDTLCEAVEKVKVFTQEEKEHIYGAKKTNASKRSFLLSEYYDDESIELIHNRDTLLIEKFGYSPP